ncbi:hypothetical protein [Tumebacillus avium]|nr:hypothetical protein [Tumebacillus avium]
MRSNLPQLDLINEMIVHQITKNMAEQHPHVTGDADFPDHRFLQPY